MFVCYLIFVEWHLTTVSLQWKEGSFSSISPLSAAVTDHLGFSLLSIDFSLQVSYWEHQAHLSVFSFLCMVFPPWEGKSQQTIAVSQGWSLEFSCSVFQNALFYLAIRPAKPPLLTIIQFSPGYSLELANQACISSTNLDCLLLLRDRVPKQFLKCDDDTEQQIDWSNSCGVSRQRITLACSPPLWLWRKDMCFDKL